MGNILSKSFISLKQKFEFFWEQSIEKRKNAEIFAKFMAEYSDIEENYSNSLEKLLKSSYD